MEGKEGDKTKDEAAKAGAGLKLEAWRQDDVDGHPEAAPSLFLQSCHCRTRTWMTRSSEMMMTLQDCMPF